MGLRTEPARPCTLRIARARMMIDLNTTSAWCRGYCWRVQHCGCDSESDIVKNGIHEHASVLLYMYIDISNQPPRVHTCTLVIRMQDIVFLSDILGLRY